MHHANLLVGKREWGYLRIPEIDKVKCADVEYCEYERLNIENARELVKRVLLKPIERPYRVFIIQTESILGDAQNALLKLFEEPNAQTRFYLIIPREDMLLPTLRSRLHLLGSEEVGGKSGVLQEFVKMSYAERLALIAEKIKAEDSEWVEQLLTDFELSAEEKKNAEKMRDVLFLKTYITTPGCSKKMLLEHFALSL